MDHSQNCRDCSARRRSRRGRSVSGALLLAATLASPLTGAAVASSLTYSGANSHDLQPGRRSKDNIREPFDVVAQGVDTRTRNFADSHTDIALPGALGPRVALTRTFSANDPSEGPFGTGWSWRFVFAPASPFAPHTGDVATLDGSTYSYAAAIAPGTEPLLKRVTDRHGNQVCFRFSSKTPGAKRLLMSVEAFHADSRGADALVKDYSLAIRWNTEDPRHPRVVSATSYQEKPRRVQLQRVTYEYANGPSHSVTSERSPGGKVTRYAYHIWTSPAILGAALTKESDLLSAITDADGAATRIAYNDEWGGAYSALTQPEAARVQAARVTAPDGRVTEFVPAGADGGALGTHLLVRHTELMPGGAEGYSVRSVYYVPDAAGVWVVSGWHSLGVERRYDLAGRLTEEDSRAGFRWSHRVPERLLAPPAADMDYDDRRHFWTLVDMMHAVFWQDVFSPGVSGTQLLDGGIVSLRKAYAYDGEGRRTLSTVRGFPFTPDESLPETDGTLTYQRRDAYWGPEKYGQKKMEIDPAGRRVFYDYYDSHAASRLRGNLRIIYADVSAGVTHGRAAAYNPFDRPMGLAVRSALDARPRPGAVPVIRIDRFDALGQPQTVRTLETLFPIRFAVERRRPSSAPLGLVTDTTVASRIEIGRTITVRDPLGRVTREIAARDGHVVSDLRTFYTHLGGDLLAGDGEVERRRRQASAAGKGGVQDFQYTPGGRLLRRSVQDGDGPRIRRTVRYERRSAFTGRPLAMDETWDGAPRFHLAYTYGGFDGEDLLRKTLTLAGPISETWSWDYGRTFSAAGLGARRIPSRIVQTAPPASHLPIQAIDYLYDSCLGELGLVRYAVVDDAPSELATQWLQDQHPREFQFVWYAHDSFGRTYDTRRYRAQYGKAPRLSSNTYTLTARTERFRLKPDANNLSGYDPLSFTIRAAPFDPAGNSPFQRTTQFDPDGNSPRATRQEMRNYDLSDRLATVLTNGKPTASQSYDTVGDWSRATQTDFEDYEGLTQPLWSPSLTCNADANISRRVRRAEGGYTDIFLDDGQILMERDYDKNEKLTRVRTRLIGARGIEAVTETDGRGHSRIAWTSH